ncbi:MAG TPA: GNAT family N-acetyltransferase [Acidimicrobiia bacterium]
MALVVPALDGGVLRLRPPEAADVDAVVEMCQDETAARFTTLPWPYERHHAVTWIAESARCWAEGVSAAFVMVETANGDLVGNLGVVRLDPDHDTAEVGYLVKRAARGRGFAPRAVALVARWILRDLGYRRLELQTDVRNHASQRVAEKAGFTREGEVDPPARCRDRSDRMVMFALTRSGLRE